MGCQQAEPFLSDRYSLLFEGGNQTVQLSQEGFQCGLVTQHVGAVSRLTHLQQERFVQELLGHRFERPDDVPAVALLNLVERIVFQPVKEGFMGGVLNGVKELVHHLVEHGFGIEFHPVGGVLADFARKTAHDCLEELVDGADRETSVIVQDPAEPLRRQRGPPVIAARKLVQLFDDA